MESICAENQDISIQPTNEAGTVNAAYPWLNWFVNDFIKKPGQHMIELGKTGTGKTQFFYWLVDMFRHYAPYEALVWFDIGKGQYDPSTKQSGNELLTLLYYFGDVRIITLEGTQIHIDSDKHLGDVEEVFIPPESPGMIWQHIKPDRLNIISIDPFVEDDILYADIFGQIFTRLIFLANRGKVYRPMTIFYDEFHNVCPAGGMSAAGSRKAAFTQNKVNGLMKKNIQKLRSTGIRFIGTSHQWTQLYKPVRMSFEWICVRRGVQFSRDEGGLAAFNPRWRKMETKQAYIVIPTGDHIGPFDCVYYKTPKGLGTLEYEGII